MYFILEKVTTNLLKYLHIIILYLYRLTYEIQIRAQIKIIYIMYIIHYFS